MKKDISRLILPGTFITFEAEDASTTIGYIGNFLDDFQPILLIIVAVGVALIVVWALVSMIKK